MTSREKLLAIYLNDHLAGSTAGAELAERLATAEAGHPDGETLRELAQEIKGDRQALLDIMATLDIPVAHYKTWISWVAEKLTRLKPNGHLLKRSPLSRLVELETMRLGVEGKAEGWRTLRALATQDPRLDKNRLDELMTGAHNQSTRLEQLRVTAAADLFGGESPPSDTTPKDVTDTT